MAFIKTAQRWSSLAVLILVAETFWAIGQSNYDLSKMSDLTNLYNSKVFRAERMTRPLDHWPFEMGHIRHSGVRVTLEDGTQWLVHKGNNFGISSQTVVTDPRHMSNRWKVKETKDFGGSKTVSDFVEAGGTGYNLLFDNCHGAARRMMKDEKPQAK